MEMKDRADLTLTLLVGDGLLLKGIRENGQCQPVEAGRGLDDVGDVETLEEFFAEGRNLLAGCVGIVPSGIGLLGEGGLLLGSHGIAGRLEFLVEILQLLARVGLVLGQVEAASCRDPLEFVGAEGELEEDVDAGPRVVGQVGLRLPVVVEILGTETD